MSSGSEATSSRRDQESGPVKKRASKACSRCRRYRTKCVPLRPNRVGEPPCGSCIGLGLANECEFLPRGQSAVDRAHRRRHSSRHSTHVVGDMRMDHPHSPSERDYYAPPSPDTSSTQTLQGRNFHSIPAHISSPIFTRPSQPPPRLPSESRPSPLAGLPPQSEVVEAIRNYVSSYFQLGFLHKAMFVERYMGKPESISEFLLLAICSIAAPFTPSIVSRYGGKKKATDFFLSRADEILGREMISPSLERAQGFLLLGVAEWGQGHGPKAWMLIGTAVRMAGFLGLHRESTYQLPPNPSPEAFIESEVARRTFWAITCHENLLSGQSRPLQISLTEVDVLLPCEETEFNFGIFPKSRASIAGTLSGAADGFRTADPEDKSLFASLVQVKILWSLTARHACRGSGRFENAPWTSSSQTLLTALQDFEASLPVKHRFSITNLRGMMVEGLDLAFLSITLITRLSNIVIRRLYLPSMANAIDPENMVDCQYDSREFWRRMADEMIVNSEQLLSQVETFFGMRSVQLGFPPIMVFGVYMCGNVFSYLCRWPELCLPRAGSAKESYERCVHILEQLADSWPLASQWHLALKSSASRPMRQTQMGYNRIRTSVQDEPTLDDEMAGIYGRPAASIVGSSPDDRPRHIGGDRSSEPLAQRTPIAAPSSALAAAMGGTQYGQINSSNLSYLNVPAMNADTTALPEPSVVSLLIQDQGHDYNRAHDYTQIHDRNHGYEAQQGNSSDYFLDTFGDDLSAFLQSAVPVDLNGADDGIGQLFFGDGNGMG